MLSYIFTGGTGFVGKNILKAFLKNRNNRIFLLIRKSSFITPDIRYDQNIYFFSIEEIKKILENNQIEGIIHLATSYGRNNETISQIIDTNLNLPLKLLEIATAYKIKFFLNTDTFYESKMNFINKLQYYTLSKEQFKTYGKKMARENGISFINVKLFHVYGAEDSSTKFIPKLISDLCGPFQNLHFSKGKDKRDFIHVNDVSLAYSKIVSQFLKNKRVIKNFEIGTGKLLSIRYLINLAHKLSNSKSKIIFDLPSNFKNKPSKSKANLKNISKLNWKPKISLDEGLLRLVKFKLSNN